MITNPEYFIAIAETGSLTKAAKRLYVSQPYLSQYVKKLEASLDTELFDHSSSPLKLTYAGELYYTYLLQLIHLTENIEKSLRDVKNEDSGRLRVGMSPWRMSVTIPLIFPELHRRYPNIHLDLAADPPMRLLESLKAGELDLVVVNSGSLSQSDSWDKIDYEELFVEKLLFAVPENHPAVHAFLQEQQDLPQAASSAYCDNKKTGSKRSPLTLLNEIPLIKTKTTLANFPSHLDQMIRQYHLKPNVLIQTRNFDTALNLAATGIGCTFTVESSIMVQGISRSLIYFPFDFQDFGEPTHTIIAVYRKGGYLTRTAQLFIETAKNVYQEYRATQQEEMSSAVRQSY